MLFLFVLLTAFSFELKADPVSPFQGTDVTSESTEAVSTNLENPNVDCCPRENTAGSSQELSPYESQLIVENVVPKPSSKARKSFVPPSGGVR